MALTRVGSFIWAHLGHCAICTRKAFLAAASAWAASAILALTVEWPQALALAAALATALTALWVAHLLAFAGKAWGRARKMAPALPDPSRRAFLPVFAKTLAFAAVASTMPRLAFAAAGPSGDAPVGWTPIGEGKDAVMVRIGSGCIPRSWSCNSCCGDGNPGVLYIRSDCFVGCALGCTGHPCDRR